MRRARDLTVIALYLLVAVAPLVGVYTSCDNVPIAGAVPAVRRPTWAVEPFLHEDYQKGVVSWLESQLGFRGVSVRVDNSILYHLFGETKAGSNVKVGTDGVLYEQDDIEYYSKYGPYLPPPAAVDELAAKIAKLQGWLAAMRRGFVPVLIPAKTTIWRDTIPPRWVRGLRGVPYTDDAVYRAMIAAFDRHGVVYVDARALLERSAEPRPHLWGHDARHWSSYAACLTMREVLAAYTRLTHRATGDYPCALELRRDLPAGHVDFDLWGLLNAWGVPRDAAAPVIAPPPGPATTSYRPSALLVGCSFSWTLLRDAERSQRLGKLHMNYYNKTFVAWPEDVHTPVEVGSPQWNQISLTKDLYVLDLTETYLLAPAAYSSEVVDQLSAAYLP